MSKQAALDLALRRRIARKHKGAMIVSIAELTDLPGELGAPVVTPSQTS